MIFNMTSPVLKSKDKVPVLGEDFTYTGSCEVIDDSDAVSGVQWRIKFYTSGTLVTNQDWVVDLFLVGGGGNGVNGAGIGWGGGGGGGYTGTFRQLTIEAQQSYSIVIGGSAGATSALGQSVNGGSSGGTSYGGAGGSGGGAAASRSVSTAGGKGGSDGSSGSGTSVASGGTGQGTSTREFGETGGTLYAGGGSGASNTAYQTPGGDGGGGAGAATQGSTTVSKSGGAGATNTGGGGGGAGIPMEGSAGVGGSGIAIIRKARTTATLKVNAPTGSTVTAELNGKMTQLYEWGGVFTCKLDEFGTYTVTATLGDKTASTTVAVTEAKDYTVTLAYTLSVSISGTVDAGIYNCYVKINNVYYGNINNYLANFPANITITPGTEIQVGMSGSEYNSSTCTINGQTVISTQSGSTKYYTFTPTRNCTIVMNRFPSGGGHTMVITY